MPNLSPSLCHPVTVLRTEIHGFPFFALFCGSLSNPVRKFTDIGNFVKAEHRDDVIITVAS